MGSKPVLCYHTIVKGDAAVAIREANTRRLTVLAITERTDGSTHVWYPEEDADKLKEWALETPVTDEMFGTQVRRWGEGTLLTYGAVSSPGCFQ